MKRILLAAIAVFYIYSEVNAQEVTSEKPKRFDKVVAGLVFNPEFLTCTDLDPANDRYEWQYKNKLSYGFGLNIAYKFNDAFALNVGVMETMRRFYRKEICFDCDNGFNYESDITNKYIEVPVSASYYVINKRLDLFFNLGFTTSILHASREERNSITGEYFEFNTKSDYNNFLLGCMGGTGINYNLNYRLSLGLNAAYRMHFMNVSDYVPLKMSGLSASTGLYYKF